MIKRLQFVYLFLGKEASISYY